MRRGLLAGVFLMLGMAMPCSGQKNDRGQQKEIDKENRKVVWDKSFSQCKQLASSNDAGQEQQAIGFCSQVIEHFPHSSWGYFYRGTAYMGTGHLDEAIQDGEASLQYIDTEKPEYERVMKEAAATFYRLRAEKFAKAGDGPKVVADETRALEINPADVRARFGRAHWFYWLNRFGESVTDFEQFLKEYASVPTQTIALAVQGKAYLKLSNKDAALANVRKIIEIQPRLAAQYGGDNALDLLDAEKRRQQAREFLRLALAAEQKGDLLEAFQDYNRARGYPLFVRTYPGDWSWAEGYTKDDMALLNEMVPVLPRIYPKLPAQPALPEEARRLAVQAGLASKDSRYDDAIALYDQLEEITPWWPQAHFNRALLLAQRGQVADAIYEMKRYLAFAPNAPDARQAQDKIYEWESLAAQAATLLKSLQGDWACHWKADADTTYYYYDLKPTNSAQFEMFPVKETYLNVHYVPGPFGLPGRVAYDNASKPMSREADGYASLALQESRSLQGTYNYPTGVKSAMAGKIGEDHKSMTFSRGSNEEATCNKQQ